MEFLGKTIGEVLVALQIISHDQLLEAIRLSVEKKISVEAFLLAEGLITEQDFAKALSLHGGFGLVERVLETMVDLNVLGRVPLKFLRRYIVMPIFYKDRMMLLTSDPRQMEPVDSLALLFKVEMGQVVATRDVILDAINKFYPFETSKEMVDELKDDGDDEFDLGAIDSKDLMEMANDAPIVKLVNHLIFQAVKEGASDIHIEPFEKELSIRYRIDGIMYQRVTPPKRYHAAIVSRIKILASLNIAEKRMPQGGRIQVRVAEKAIDLRVSVLPCNFGERVVMRILDKTKGVGSLDSLMMSDHNLQLLRKMIARPNGTILVSGPTGSGKTTTLYSILTELNQPNVNIVTVEDPVEYTVFGVNQVQAHEKIGLTFAIALREILRQDPDIVLIGEVRDTETAQIAIQASLTGHLVLSTIHTNSAPGTVTRLIDMGIEPFLVASTLLCVVSQRLVRKLCNACKILYTPTNESLARLGLMAESVSVFYKAHGCDECGHSGYRGRLAVYEMMEVNDELAAQIVARADTAAIKQKALELGMTSLIADGVRIIQLGYTTIEEVLAVAYVDI